MKFNFAGYATRYDVECSDGRTILVDAFQHQDGAVVPLVWQHQHNDARNVLGKAVLEHREDGVYVYASFNETEAGQTAKALVEHGDVAALSIYANGLREDNKQVSHGNIKEVSVVLSGANPGAMIENVILVHSDNTEKVLEDTVVIHGGIAPDDLEGGEIEELDEDSFIEHQEGNGKTVKDVFDSFSEEQKTVVYFMIGQALKDAGGKVTHDDIMKGKDDIMKLNAFDNQDNEKGVIKHLDRDQMRAIFADVKTTGSLEQAILKHAGTYGIDNIDVLFPDAKSVMERPEFIKRRTEWVNGVLNEVSKSPFAKIKTMHADITADEARAKGYVTGAEKTEEVFNLLQRETSPTTVYKKQKLDRDDILDITDFDVVAWIKYEMRIMLDEEIARAILIGDGRATESADKIKENKIIPIYKDVDMYAHKYPKLAVDATPEDLIEATLRARKFYKGSGRPSFYADADTIINMLLIKDNDGHRMYKTREELAAALGVAKVVEVEVMEGTERNDGVDNLLLKGIMVNLQDYKTGTNRGGEVNFFDDFDIDFNQEKYLLETRLSGMLVKAKSAVILEQIKAAG